MPELTLDWKGAPGNIIAQGQRGMYSIQTVGSQFILQAVDGDARNDLGFFGREFGDLELAKSHAQDVDDE